jgi:hypothetical protein
MGLGQPPSDGGFEKGHHPGPFGEVSFFALTAPPWGAIDDAIAIAPLKKMKAARGLNML